MSDNRTALGIAAALAAAAGAAWFLKSRSQATKWLESDDVLAWIDRYDTFLLDCDGVVWRGDSVVPGVPEALAALKKRGKKVLYISNNASKHRSAYMSKFKKMGIDACMEDVVTSALGAAKYFVGKYGKGAKVFVCGTEGLIQEFKEAGAHVVEPKYVTSETVCVGGPSMVEPGELDPEIRAIVAGADWNLNHRKISFSVLCLNMIPGCTLICTNRDRLFPAADGLQYPGAGATVAPLEVCSGQKGIDIGKPGPMLLDILAETQGIDKKRTVMVGDRLDTDIMFGRGGGVDTLLVLTGCSDRAQADAASGVRQPHFGIRSLGDLAAPLTK